MFSYLLELDLKLHNAEDEYGMEHPYTNNVRAEFVGAYNIIKFGGLLDYLLGCVGEIHSRNGWLKRIFPTKYEFAIEYFNGWSDKELFEYILQNLRIRIKKV